LAEYRKRDAEFLSRAQEHDDVIALRDAAKVRYDDLSALRLKEFMSGFTAISTKLKEMYQVSYVGMVAGGPAERSDDHHGWECGN
jgi:structural maintenance of chromosome 4